MRYFSSKSETKIPMKWEGRRPLKWDKTIILCVVHIPGKLLVPETSAYAFLCHLITADMVKSDLGSPGCLSKPGQSYNANFNIGFWEFNPAVALLGTIFIRHQNKQNWHDSAIEVPEEHWAAVLLRCVQRGCRWRVLYSWTKRHSSGCCLCTGSFQPVNTQQASDHHYHMWGLLPSDLLQCSKERKEERQSTFKVQKSCFILTACHTSFPTWKQKNAFHTSGLKPQTFVWLSLFWT